MDYRKRKEIQKLWGQGYAVKDIAPKIGKCLGTVYLELKRGYTGRRDANGRPEYSAIVAESRRRQW